MSPGFSGVDGGPGEPSNEGNNGFDCDPNNEGLLMDGTEEQRIIRIAIMERTLQEEMAMQMVEMLVEQVEDLIVQVMMKP